MCRACRSSNDAMVPPAPRRAPATSATSSTPRWTLSTSCSTRPVPCLRPRGYVARSTTRSIAGRLCNTTSCLTAARHRPLSGPGHPGSSPLDIYPLGGPDLAKARQLAGHVDAHATLYVLRATAILRRLNRAGGSQGDRNHCPHHPLSEPRLLHAAGETRRIVGHRLVELVRRFRRPVHVHQRAV